MTQIIGTEAFKADLLSLRSHRLETSLGRAPSISDDARRRLHHFTEVTLASAPSWQDGAAITALAAEVADGLVDIAPATARQRLRLRATLLYELASMPGSATNLLERADMVAPLAQFLRREQQAVTTGTSDVPGIAEDSHPALQDLAQLMVAQDAVSLMRFERGLQDAFSTSRTQSVSHLALTVDLGLSATEAEALEMVLSRRYAATLRANVAPRLFAAAQSVGLPGELWPTQVEAIKRGLLDPRFDAWGLSTPTGTGKSFLTRLLILDQLERTPEGKIVYLCPSKSLVYEVEQTLKETLAPLDIGVASVKPALMDPTDEEDAALAAASVIVITPEKADMLLRLGHAFFEQTELLIVDEAHHLETPTRGILLELYLWRLRKLLNHRARIILLSAVLPNMLELAKRIGTNGGGATIDQRGSRLRVGTYQDVDGNDGPVGVLEFTDGTTTNVFSTRGLGKTEQLIRLVAKRAEKGIVLVVTKGRATSQTLAKKLFEYYEQHEPAAIRLTTDDLALMERLDSRLEREMYAEVELRRFLAKGVAYHHGGLPPRVRTTLEQALNRRLLRVVFATTTLNEGVNFPIATVIVQSLQLREPPEKGRPSRYSIMTPRAFWNIAGRAGRPGLYRLGEVILFGPSLGKQVVGDLIKPYLDPRMASTGPLRTALTLAMGQMHSELAAGTVTPEDLATLKLPTKVPKEMHSAVNLLRVGLVHARGMASRGPRTVPTPEEIADGVFGPSGPGGPPADFVRQMVVDQDRVVGVFLAQHPRMPAEFVAQIGLSLETLEDLQSFVASREDWQLEGLSSLLRGGGIDWEQIEYVLSPVAARMHEFDGAKLGGFYVQILLDWLSGLPFSRIRLTGKNWNFKSIEDLIVKMYTKIQYLLPWGLHAFDQLVKAEAAVRGLTYNGAVGQAAFLVNEGVPNIDALRLVNLQVERVDATRLAAAFAAAGGRQLGVDVLGWFAHTAMPAHEGAVRGRDRRRIDPDLRRIWESLQGRTPARPA